VVLFLLPGYVSRVLEIRPDVLAAAAFVGASALVVRPGGGTRRHLVAGLLAGAAILATQKSVQYLWGLPIAALFFEGPMVSWRTRLANLGALAAGIALPLVALGAVLFFVGAGASFWNQNVELALRWQTLDYSFPFTRYLPFAAEGSALWLAIAGAGAAFALVGARLEPDTRAARQRLFAIALPALISLLLLPNPWPYNFVPVYAIWTPFAAIAFGVAGRYFGAVPRARMLAGIAVLAAGLATLWFVREVERSNAGQLELVDRTLELAAPGTPIFDDNGGYLFRPSAYFLWYHSKAMRLLLARQLESEVPAAVLRAGAPVWLFDPLRFRELPDSVRDFATSHYQPFLGTIHLWGSRLGTSVGDSSRFETDFLAVRDGQYFVTRRSGSSESAPTVSVDGSAVALDEPFALTAGTHTIEVADLSPGSELFALWLPDTKQLWQPDPTPGPWLYPYLF
jgi:hypothetical protein